MITKLIVLDRDGLLNVDVGYTYRLEDLQLAPGVIDGLTLLKSLGCTFAIATGQSGISKGKYSVEQMHAFNSALLALLKPHNIVIDTVVFCPHDKGEGCKCRKPEIGMLEQIEEKLGKIDWPTAWGIGDKPSDAEMILSVGGSSVLIESGPHNNTTGESYWTLEDQALTSLLKNSKNFVAHDLNGAALAINKHLDKSGI